MDNAQIPGMPKKIDNVNLRVRDDLEDTITKKSKLRIAVACFSIYTYEELKKSLSGCSRFFFTFFCQCPLAPATVLRWDFSSSTL